MPRKQKGENKKKEGTGKQGGALHGRAKGRQADRQRGCGPAPESLTRALFARGDRWVRPMLELLARTAVLGRAGCALPVLLLARDVADSATTCKSLRTSTRWLAALISLAAGCLALFCE